MDEDPIILNEGITNYGVISNHIEASCPWLLLWQRCGFTGLAWRCRNRHEACQTRTRRLSALLGMAPIYSAFLHTVHWMAKRYNTPFLTVIYNNQGWKAPKHSTLGVHPNGVANETQNFFVNFDPTADYAQIAASPRDAHAVR